MGPDEGVTVGGLRSVCQLAASAQASVFLLLVRESINSLALPSITWSLMATKWP
jgi:hypothetical protein